MSIKAILGSLPVHEACAAKASIPEFRLTSPGPLHKSVQKSQGCFQVVRALHTDYTPPTAIHSDIPQAQEKARATLVQRHSQAASPIHVAGPGALKKEQTEGLAEFFRTTQEAYFLQEPVPRSLGWPNRTRDLSVAEVLKNFGADNLQQLIAYKEAGMTGRKKDGSPINGYVGDMDHLLAYLNVVNDNSTVKAAQIFKTNIFMNTPLSNNGRNYLVQEVMQAFDIHNLNDLSNIHNDYEIGQHRLGGTVLGGEIFDIPELRQSLQVLQGKTAEWATQLPGVLEHLGDSRTAGIARRAQSMLGPFND